MDDRSKSNFRVIKLLLDCTKGKVREKRQEEVRRHAYFHLKLR